MAQNDDGTGGLAFAAPVMPTASRLRTKLIGAGERFIGFDRILEEEANRRFWSEEENRIWLLHTLKRLQFTLHTEIERRVEASKTLQQATEEFSNELYISLQKKVDMRIGKLVVELEGLRLRCVKLEEKARSSGTDNTEIGKLQGDTEALEMVVEELKLQFGSEQSKAVNTNVINLKRVEGISERIGKNFEAVIKLDGERYEYLAREMQNLHRMEGETAEEEFHAYCLEAILCLRKKQEKEELSRKKHDEHILDAIERYANTLQKGLRNGT